MKRSASLPPRITEQIRVLSQQTPDGAPLLAAQIRENLAGILLSGAPDEALEAMHRMGILARVLPELAACDVPQGSMHRYSVLVHSFKAVAAVKPELHLRLAALFHDVGKASTCQWDDGRPRFPGHAGVGAGLALSRLTELGYDPDIINKVERLVRWHMFEPGPAATVEALERLVARVGPDLVIDLVELRRVDILACGTAIDPGMVEYLRLMAGRLSGIVEGLSGRESARIEREQGGEN